MTNDRFETFVTGKANEVAASAALTLATTTLPAFNPLFIRGGPGTGKTHLLGAMAHSWRDRAGEAGLLQISADELTLGYAAAVKRGEQLEYLERLRRAKLLLVDNIELLTGKDFAQDLLLGAIGAALASGDRVAVSADRAPHDLEAFSSRLTSLLGSGLVVDLNPPDLELSFAILQARAEAIAGAGFPEDVLWLLARRLGGNVRTMVGALNRLASYAIGLGRPIDREFVDHIIGELLRAHRRRITIEEIQRRVSEHYRIRTADMTSARRSRDVTRPRQVAMYLSKQLTPLSLPAIGRRFGGRDHTTIIHGVRQIEKRRAVDAELDRDIRHLERELQL